MLHRAFVRVRRCCLDSQEHVRTVNTGTLCKIMRRQKYGDEWAWEARKRREKPKSRIHRDKDRQTNKVWRAWHKSRSGHEPLWGSIATSGFMGPPLMAHVLTPRSSLPV